MIRTIAVVCSLALCLVVAGCSRTYSGPRRFALSGKVTVDKQPLDHGLISFLPDGEGGRVCGGPITAGSYAISEEMGATEGKYKVKINWNKPTGKKVKDAWGEEIMDETKEGLPARYHADSELNAEVAAGKTTFDFDLQSK
jgi:hypothetical protein